MYSFFKRIVTILCVGISFEFVRGNVDTPPLCKGVKEAIEQLSDYYTFWYRVWHMGRTSTLCEMKHYQKRRMCAKIIKYCLREFEHSAIEDIELQIKSVLTNCYKEFYHIKPEGDWLSWMHRKNMFVCPKITYCEKGDSAVCRSTVAFWISAGGKINSALVFHKTDDNNEYVQPFHFAENLNFETNDGKLLPITTKDNEGNEITSR